MRNKCGFNVETNRNKGIAKTLFGGRTVYGVTSKFIPKVFADGGDNNEGGEGGENKPTINYEDLIAKARKEEKDKQYKTIEKLKAQIDTLTKQHNDDLLVVADLKDKLTKAEEKLTKAGKGDTEEVETLKGEIKTLKEDLAKAENKVKEFEEKKPVDREEIEKEIREELEEEYKVKTYKAEKLAEHKDEILVPELVMGTTIEDIDASIQSALERSSEIRRNLGIEDGDTKKPPKKTPKNTGNPDSSGTQRKKYSAEYIASLDPASPEYAEVRKQLGLR